MTIAVYGASGHTGRLIVTELRKRGVDPVLIGRDADRLRAVGAETGVPEAIVRVAGLDDPALIGAFRDVDTVINAVAPFVRFGEPVVRAAIAAGAHYVDISGEQTYVRRIFDTVAELAREAGVTVVPMVNDGGLIGDMISSLAAARVERPEQVTIAHRVTGGAALSRGSGRTALANAELFVSGGEVYSGGAWRPETPVRTKEIIFPGESRASEVVKLALAEVATVPRHVPADHVEGVTDAAIAALLVNISPELAEALPEFPQDDPESPDRFLVLADVTGSDGGARGYVEGANSYRTTSVAAAEAAVRLAEGGAQPGVLAPSQAFDPASFLDSLAPHGVRWSVT